MPTTTPFANLITFSRGSNATVVGPNGLVQWAPSNLLTFSEQFDNAAWTKTASTVTANSTAAPDGTMTADTLTASAGTGVTPRVADISITTVNAAAYTASLYVKAGTYTLFQIYLNNQGADWANFTLTGAGTASANGSCTATITALSGGWYRCTMSYTAGGTDRRPFFMLAASGTATRAQTWNPAGTETIFIWGAQLELGSAATTYNPTTVKNLLGFSEAFDNAAWTKTRSSIVTGAQANPVNGLFNAQKLMEDTTASNTHFASQTFTFVANPYTFSVYAKAAGRNWVYLALPSTTNSFASFNLSNGTVGTVGAAATAAIQDVGNGWYRCRITSTATAGAGTAAVYSASADNTISYTGDGNSGVFIYGAQLSDSASLDPYVPTPGAAPSSTAYYGPRFDYDPVTRQPRGILIEEQRTNLFTYSEQFDNVAWTKTNLAISTNTTVAPDGTTTADKVIKNATTSAAFVGGFVSVAGNVTFSVYLKAAEQTNALVYIENSAFSGTAQTVVNLSTGGLTNSTTGTGVAITSTTAALVGNGWYRVTLSVNITSGTATVPRIYSCDAAGNTGNTGDGVSGFFIYGAQLEAGAFATSYIPTIASTVTRSADVATITGQNFGQFYRQDEGTFVVEATTTAESARLATTSAGTITNQLWLQGGGVSEATLQVYTAGAFVAQIGILPAAANKKIAGAYRTNDFAASIDGGAVATDTSGALATYDRVNIGSNFNGTVGFTNGYIRSIRYIPVRAADFQLQALTT